MGHAGTAQAAATVSYRTVQRRSARIASRNFPWHRSTPAMSCMRVRTGCGHRSRIATTAATSMRRSAHGMVIGHLPHRRDRWPLSASCDGSGGRRGVREAARPEAAGTVSLVAVHCRCSRPVAHRDAADGSEPCGSWRGPCLARRPDGRSWGSHRRCRCSRRGLHGGRWQAPTVLPRGGRATTQIPDVPYGSACHQLRSLQVGLHSCPPRRRGQLLYAAAFRGDACAKEQDSSTQSPAASRKALAGPHPYPTRQRAG